MPAEVLSSLKPHGNLTAPNAAINSDYVHDIHSSVHNNHQSLHSTPSESRLERLLSNFTSHSPTRPPANVSYQTSDQSPVVIPKKRSSRTTLDDIAIGGAAESQTVSTYSAAVIPPISPQPQLMNRESYNELSVSSHFAEFESDAGGMRSLASLANDASGRDVMETKKKPSRSLLEVRYRTRTIIINII